MTTTDTTEARRRAHELLRGLCYSVAPDHHGATCNAVTAALSALTAERDAAVAQRDSWARDVEHFAKRELHERTQLEAAERERDEAVARTEKAERERDAAVQDAEVLGALLPNTKAARDLADAAERDLSAVRAREEEAVRLLRTIVASSQGCPLCRRTINGCGRAGGCPGHEARAFLAQHATPAPSGNDLMTLCPHTGVYKSRCTHCGNEPLGASVAATLAPVREAPPEIVPISAPRWIPFNGSRGKLPPKKRLVLVAFKGEYRSSDHSGTLPAGLCVAYLKFAGGDPASPYFVHFGINEGPGRPITHWSDCLGSDFTVPGWANKWPNRDVRAAAPAEPRGPRVPQCLLCDVAQCPSPCSRCPDPDQWKARRREILFGTATPPAPAAEPDCTQAVDCPAALCHFKGCHKWERGGAVPPSETGTRQEIREAPPVAASRNAIPPTNEGQGANPSDADREGQSPAAPLPGRGEAADDFLARLQLRTWQDALKMIEARDNAHAEAVRRARADALREALMEVRAQERGDRSGGQQGENIRYGITLAARAIERLSTQPPDAKTPATKGGNL